MAKLEIVEGGSGSFDLGPGTTLIGRSSRSTIVLDDKSVKMRHAEISLEDGKASVQKKGTATIKVNDQETRSSDLSDGDVITLGDLKLKYTATADGAAPAAPADPLTCVCGKKARSEKLYEIHVKRCPKAKEAGLGPEAKPEPATAEETTRTTRRSERTSSSTAVAGSTDRELAKAQVAIEAYEKKTSRLESQIERLNKKIADLEASDAQALEGELKTANKEITDLNRQIDRKEGEIKRLKDKVDVLESSGEKAASQMESQYKALEEHVQQMHLDKEALEKQIEEFQDAIQNNEDQYTAAMMENDDLREKLSVMEYQVEKAEASTGTLVREKVQDIQAQCDALIEENEALQQKLNAYEEKIDELDEKVQEAEGKNMEMEDMLAEQTEELKGYREQEQRISRGIGRKVKELEDELNTLREENQRLKEMNEKLDAVKHDYEAKLEKLKA